MPVNQQPAVKGGAGGGVFWQIFWSLIILALPDLLLSFCCFWEQLRWLHCESASFQSTHAPGLASPRFYACLPHTISYTKQRCHHLCSSSEPDVKVSPHPGSSVLWSFSLIPLMLVACR